MMQKKLDVSSNFNCEFRNSSRLIVASLVVTEQLIHEIGITEDMFLIFMELQMSGVSISLFCKK